MADPKTPPAPPATPPTPPAPPKDDKGGGGETGDAMVRRVVTEMFSKLKPGGGAPAAEHDITAQVEAAVTKVHQGQQAQQVITDLQARIAELEKRPVIEKKPREYRGITKRIWGADDDD